MDSMYDAVSSSGAPLKKQIALGLTIFAFIINVYFSFMTVTIKQNALQSGFVDAYSYITGTTYETELAKVLLADGGLSLNEIKRFDDTGMIHRLLTFLFIGHGLFAVRILTAKKFKRPGFPVSIVTSVLFFLLSGFVADELTDVDSIGTTLAGTVICEVSPSVYLGIFVSCLAYYFWGAAVSDMKNGATASPHPSSSAQSNGNYAPMYPQTPARAPAPPQTPARAPAPPQTSAPVATGGNAFCTQCRNPLSPGTKFCGKCGSRQ